MNKLFTLLASTLLSIPVLAQSNSIELKGNKVSLSTHVDHLYQVARNNKMLVIQTEQPVKKQTFSQNGWTLVSSLGNNYYIVIPDVNTKQQPNKHLSIIAWQEVPASLKIADNALSANGIITYSVKLTATTDIAAFKQKASILGAVLSEDQQWSKQFLYEIKMHSNALATFAAFPEVIAITLPIHDETLLEHAKYYTGAGSAILPTALGGRNLKGRNIVVGVGDDAHPFHLDVQDRLINLNPLNQSTHGYHVATTVGGAGIIDPKFTGFAPKSTIVANYFSNIISETETYMRDFGMTVTNNSYGAELNNCAAFGLYSIYSQSIDEQLVANPKMLHVFAAGNSANRQCNPFPWGYRTVAGHYQPTKNVLTVANIGKTETLFNSTSSRGPTIDGRIKPEITAMGSSLIAGGNNNNYFANTGTSMASPNVAGAAALLQERYVQLFGDIPEADILKAILINGATDIGNTGPDFRFGYGLMNVEHSLKMLENNTFKIDTINTNQNKTLSIVIPPNTTQVKVMLYWADAPGNLLSAKNLTNDLDLTVTENATSTVYLPWILNPLPANILDNAVRGIDRLNNVEQVTIDNPTSGAYTINVAGFDVAITDQRYVVAYEFIDDNIKLRFPQGGEKVVAGDPQYIYWESPYTTNSTTVQFSSNGGTNWTTIATITDGLQRSLEHTFPNTINSHQCKLRVIQNGKTVTSNNFTVGLRPTVSLAPVAQQCPGSIKINWTATPNAGKYRVYIKRGDEMQMVDSTTSLTYTFNGLNQNETYWVAVASVIDSVETERSVAVNRLPYNGNCTNAVNGDLAIIRATPNTSGRKHTSKAFSNTTPITATIQNLSGATANTYRIHYKWNNAPWATTTVNTTLANRDTIMVNVATLDLSNAGKYEFTFVVENISTNDLVKTNDTIKQTVFHWANEPLDLYSDLVFDFENNNFNLVSQSTIGIDSLEYLDFSGTTIYSQATSFVNSSLILDGTRSFAMNTNRNVGNIVNNASKNNLIATFNLSGHDTAESEVRLEFEYLLPAYPNYDSINSVWVRNHENSNWVKILDYYVDTVTYTKQHSGSISLQNIFRQQNWNFTSSVQVKWEQYSNTLLSSNSYGQGVVLDNIKLYKVSNDVFVVGTDSLYNFNCQLSNAVPLKVKVGNGVNNTVYQVAISYQIDNGAILTEYIDSIGAKDTVTYTFTNPIDLSTIKTYTLNTWVYLSNDTYRLNDSLLQYNVTNQPLISTFPYLQNFEDNDGSYLVQGINSSWVYGTPRKSKMTSAASGTKAWVTDTIGHYNGREHSSLYSPCFDVSSLQEPYLSFSFFYELENASTQDSTVVYDRTFVEYTNDGGHTWQKLGTSGNTTNSYNHPTQVFTGNNHAYWQVVTMPIPASTTQFAFRINLITDENSNYQGVGIDDIHIYDLQQPIYTGNALSSPLTITANNSTWTPALNNNEVFAALRSTTNGNIGINTQTYLHNEYVNTDSTQYFVPRSYVIQKNSSSDDSLLVRVYVEDIHMQSVRNNQDCPSCYKPEDIYKMGISIYDDEDNTKENSLLTDNVALSNYSYLPYNKISWVPFDKGYYAEFKIVASGEIWINGGGPTKDKAIEDKIIDFYAEKKSIASAALQWTSYIDNRVLSYTLQSQTEGNDFTDVINIASNNVNATERYNHIDFPEHNGKPVRYRVAFRLQNDSLQTYYSIVRTVNWDNDPSKFGVYPNPVSDGLINIEWNKQNDQPVKWALYNAVGQLLGNAPIESNPYGGKYTLDINQLGHLANGLYILRVYTSKNEIYDFKINIQYK